MTLRQARLPAVILALAIVAGVGVYRSMKVETADQRFAELQSRIRVWDGHLIPEENRDPALAPIRRVIGRETTNRIAGKVGNHAPRGNVDATRAQLDELLEGQPFSRVTLGGCSNLDDDWIAGIVDPSAIIQLNIGATRVTDRSTEAILRMKGLRGLEVVDTEVSDASVDRLRGLPVLRELHVGGPNIRAVRLVQLSALDEAGRPAIRSGRPNGIEGRVAYEPPPGSARKIDIRVRVPGGWPAWRSGPYGWATKLQASTTLAEESPGAWRFRAVLDKIPPGRSTIEVWVEVPSADRRFVFYHLEPFPVDLAPPDPDR